MKAVDSKSSATNAKSNSPFFSKGGEQGFFGASLNQNGFFSRSLGPIQAKLTVGQPGDMYEKEADNMADKVVQRLSDPSSVQTKPLLSGNSVTPLIQAKCAHCEAEEKLRKKESDEDAKPIQQKPIFESEAEPDDVQRKCAHCEQEKKLQKKSIFESNEVTNEKSPNVQRKCASCEAEEKLQKKSDGSSSQQASPHVEAGLHATKGSGMPLPKDTRQQMESSFGTDFNNVRIHNDSGAASLNKDLRAQAFTHGSDIYFNSGKFDMHSDAGKHLLAHELTHVLQQNGDTVRRECDPTITSCIPKSYSKCNPTVSSCAPPVSSQDEMDALELDPGNISGSFSLIPILNPTPGMLAEIPEGQMATYDAIPVPTSVSGNIPSIKASEFVAPGSAALNAAINQSLMTSGFAPIPGGSGIGMIAIPRLGTSGAAIPESLSSWGHTAVYVRVNGQITLARGFTVESFFQAATNQSGVTSGAQAIPGTVSNDLGMFTVTNARTIEWPVSADVAKNFSDTLPAAGAPPPGGPTMYTGRPAVYGPGASNCVGWACSNVESPIGGKVTTTKLGNVSEPTNAAEGLQGRMMQLTKTASSDIGPEGAITAGMSRSLVVLKWGGRLFMVLGAAITVKQILSAQGEHKREEQGQAFGAFAGGVVVGAFTAGLCVGLGIFTAGVALLACAGIAAAVGVGGAVGGHYLGGAIGSQFDSPGNIQKKSIDECPSSTNNSTIHGSNAHGTIQRTCAACEMEDKLQRKFESGDDPVDLENKLNQSKSSGAPLPEETRNRMESSFGADFSKVRIHDDNNAADMSNALRARAFTHGGDIYFNSGKYNPDSREGKTLLAHELTHTVQQGSHSGVVQRDSNFNPQDYITSPFDFSTPQYIQVNEKQVLSIRQKSGGDLKDKVDYDARSKIITDIDSYIIKGIGEDVIDSFSTDARYLASADDPNAKLIVQLASNNLADSTEAAKKLINMGESGWSSLLRALNHSHNVVRLEALLALTEGIRTKRKLLNYIAGVAQSDQGALRVGAVRVLTKAGYGSYYDNKNFTDRIVQKLEFIKVFFNEVPLPDDKIVRQEFTKIKVEAAYRVELAVATLKSGIMPLKDLADLAQVVEIFHTGMAVASKMIAFMQIFSVQSWTLNYQSIYKEGAVQTFSLSGHLVLILFSIKESGGELVADPKGALVEIKNVLTIAEAVPKSMATASVSDLMLDLSRVEEQSLPVIDGLKASKPPDWKSHVNIIKEVVGTTKGMQQSLPQLSKLAWERPMVYFEIWEKLSKRIGEMVQKVSMVGMALNSYTLIHTIEDSWQVFAKRGDEAETNKAILQEYLKEADKIIQENLNDAEKLGAGIEKLRENERYKKALEWAENFAADEQEWREIVLAIAELALTLASIYVGGVAGRLAGLGLRAVATTGAIGAAVADSTIIGGGIVLGVETLGFVVTEKSLNQLLFGKGNWDTFLRDYVQAFLLFGALKGVGKVYEGLIASERLSVGAAKIGQFVTDVTMLTAMQKVFLEWENLSLPADEQKEFNVWQSLGHNALFLVMIKIGMLGVEKLPPPLLAGLEKKAISELEKLSTDLERKLAEMKYSKPNSKDYLSLQKQIRNVLGVRQAALRSAIANKIFKGADKDKEIAATQATILSIQNRINELDIIAELFKFNIQPTELDNQFTFEGDPKALQASLDKRTVGGKKGTFERVAEAKNSEIYRYQLGNQPPIFLELVSKSKRTRPVPADIAALKGISWKQALDGFWEAVQKQNFKFDPSFIGRAETNGKIGEALEDGWLPGKKLPKEIGRWLDQYYAKEKPPAEETSKPAGSTTDKDTGTKKEDSSLSFEQKLEEALKLNPDKEVPKNLHYAVDKLRARKVPEDQIIAIIRNAFTRSGMSPKTFFDALNVAGGKAGDVLGKSAFDKLIAGLAGETNYEGARFLLDRVSWSQAPKVKIILDAMTTDDIATLRARFNDIDAKDFTNDVATLATGVDGTAKEIADLLNAAGKGSDALSKLAEAVRRLGVGRHPATEITESLHYGQSVREAFKDVTNTENLAQKVFGKAFRGTKMVTEKGKPKKKFLVSEGMAEQFPGEVPVGIVNRVKGDIARAIMGGDGKIDMAKWDVLANIISATDIAPVQQNGVIGAIWAEAKLQEEMAGEPKGTVATEQVSVRWKEGSGWSKKFAIIDAVIRNGNKLKYREYKSSPTAEESEAQEKVYDLIKAGKMDQLQPFGEQAIKAFGGKDMPYFLPGEVKTEKAPARTKVDE